MSKTRFSMFVIVIVLSLAMVGMALASDTTAKPTAPLETNIPDGNSTTLTDTGATLDYPEKSKPEEPQGIPIPHQAGITGVSTDYAWSQTTGTYTEIVSGTQVTTNCDDTNFNNYTIPFSFTFNGVAYTSFSIQCNGFIAMGPTVVSSYTPISSGTSNNIVAALAGDLQTNLVDSAIRFEVLGSSPDRVLVIQWKNFRHYNTTGEIFNFQIRLYETSNVAQVVYGAFIEISSYTQQVGLRGNSNADFNNRKSSTGWENTVPGTLNSDSVVLSNTYYPPSGLTWTWTPVAPHPVFDASYKSAPNQVVVGDPITYAIHIINSGLASADDASMVDPIPAGTAYNGDVSCTAGTCTFNSELNQVEWAGTVPVAGDVVVTFSVATVEAACGVPVVNQVTLDDPALIGGPVARSATTQLVSTTPDPLEGFEASVPPPGWTETIVYDPGTDPDWSQVNVGTYPTISPHGGTFMAKFNSFSTGVGGASRLWTGPLDLTGYAAPEVTFWMSHDTGYASNADRLQIQVSTDGITWTDVGTPRYRYDASCGTPCWKEHAVPLTGYNLPVVYIGFLAISAYGNNFYLDDTGLTEVWYPCPALTIGPDQDGTSCAGTSIQYPMTVWNITPDADTIDVAPLGFTWPTVVDPPSLALDPGQTGDVMVTVDVPADAVPPDNDTATIEAIGLGSGLSDSATINTKVTPPFGMTDTWANVATGNEPSLFWGHSYYYGGEICVLGGLTGATPGVTGAHNCYNISSGTWSARLAIPTPVFAGAYGLIGDKFYIAGGFTDGSFTGTALLQIYDITNGTWSTGTGMPSARGGAAGGVVNGLLYSAGGSPTSSFPFDCPTYGYDPVSDTWATLATCPLQGGYGLDLGGSVGSDVHDRLFAGGHFGAYTGWFAYDPVADSWTVLASLPGSIHKTPLFVENPLSGQIYMVGGLVGWSGRNTTYEYDAFTNTWTLLPEAILNTAQGGSTGPAHGSFGDPTHEGFWTEGGTIGAGSISPAPFEFWEYGVSNCGPALEPEIEVSPLFLDQTLAPDEQAMQMLHVCNIGDLPLEWSILEVPGLNAAVYPPVPQASAPDRNSVVAPEDFDTTLTVSVNKGTLAGTVGLFKNVNPWGSLAWEEVMTANGISYEVHTSAEFASLDFDQFGMIIVACVQDQTFYNDYAANAAKFEAYISNGGFLNFCAAVQSDIVWPAPLPGGLTPNLFFENYNVIDDPAHPVVAGVPDPFFGTSASHDNFTNLPVGAHTIVHGQDTGEPTMVEFGLGSGWMIAYGQTLEYSYQNGMQGGLIVPNAVLFGYNWSVPTDIPWLSESPMTGTVPGGECMDVDVTFDSTGLSVGDYLGDLQVNSNDTDEPAVVVPVTLTVEAVQPPIFDLSEKLAPPQVFEGDPIHYTVVINNSGGPALDASMTDPIPLGATFVPGSLDCSYGTCTFDDLSNTVLWNGEVGSGGQKSSSSVDIAGGNAPAAVWPGPDGYNYNGQVIPFNWIDLTGNGTPIPGLTDDSFAGPFPIGFTFEYYGTPWTEFFASSNGFINFGSGSSSLANQCPLPNATAPNDLIAMLWDDLNFTVSGNAYYHTFDACPIGEGMCTVVEYYNVAHYLGDPGSAGTWEAVLYPDGTVILQYLDPGVETGLSSTEGIENNNAPSDYGLTYACDTGGSLAANTALKFTLEAPSQVTVEFDVTTESCPSLVENEATISDPAAQPVTVSASTDVLCQLEPEITVSPLLLDQTLLPDETAIQQLNVCNIGDGPLDWNITEAAGVKGLGLNLPHTPIVTTGRTVKLSLDGQPGDGQATNTPAIPSVDIPFILDDGSPENYIGLGDGTYGYQFIWLNRFTPAPGDFPFTLNQIQVLFGSTNVPVGGPIDLVIYEDTDGDADPSNATLLATFNETVQVADGINWSVYDLPTPVLMSGPGDILIGVINRYQESGVELADYPAGLDQTSTLQRSWVGGWTTDPPDPAILPPDDLWGLIDAWFPGNWMIRGVGEPVIFDIPWLSENPTSGSILPGDCQLVDVTFDSADLVPGEYTGALNVNSNDPDEPTIGVPVTLTVEGPPVIVVTPDALDATVVLEQSTTLPMTIANDGIANLNWDVYDGSLVIGWSENFDSYPPGTSMHGVGGWKGWANSPAATAYTSNAQSHSSPISIDIAGASDLVHEYTGYDSGTWTYTAWQYIPSSFTGQTYFILMNTYNDQQVGLNWSLEVQFNGTTSQVINDGPAGGTLPMTKGQWVELRDVIDFDADTQTFFYGGTQLFSGSWSGGMSGGGAVNLAAVDLYANNTADVYYDDLSLSQFEDTPWLTENPTSGTTPGGGSSPVDVTFNAAGLGLGVYNTTLFVSSDDPVTPLVAVPVTMTVIAPTADLELVKTAFPAEVKEGETITYTLTVTNHGPQPATNVVLVDTLPELVTFSDASQQCSETAGVVTCNLGTIAVDGTATVTIEVIADVVGTAVNSATVSSAISDPDLTNNTDTAQTLIVPAIFDIYLPIITRR